jgi:histidinol-phosphatase
MRERIAAERPGEGVFGEEEGDDEPGGDVRWIVDPIDGTRNFSRGIPIWASLVALERDRELTVGVVSAPALGRRWWAQRGGGAFADGGAIRVSAIAEWQDAAVSSSVQLAETPWHARGLGDFWQHVLVAEGALDAAVDEPLELWDYAAVQVVVEEAGGRVSDLAGGPPRPGERVVSSNGALHGSVLAAIAAAS